MLNEIVGSVIQVMMFASVPALFWYLTSRKEETFFSWIGLKKPVCRNVVKTVLITGLAALGYIGAMTMCIKMLPEGVTTSGSQFAGQGVLALPAVIFYAVLRTALSEEILFRGFILKRIKDKAGFLAGNTIQALLFGLMHGIPFAIVTKSLASFFLLTLLPGLFGWYQGWLNEKQCEGSIIPSWLLHSSMNLMTGILALYQ